LLRRWALIGGAIISGSAQLQLTVHKGAGLNPCHTKDVRVKMSSSQNFEYQTIVQCTEQLCLMLSQDLTRISNKLFALKLISEDLYKLCRSVNKEVNEKAACLVDGVRSKIKAFPKEYDTFLTALKDFPYLDDMVKHIHETYQMKKNRTHRYQVNGNQLTGGAVH